MDLAKFSQLPSESGGAYLKFTPQDNVKIIRFCYNDASEIKCRQKLYDPATKKVIWDSPEGKWTMALKVAVYRSKTEFDMMTWDRSAAFGRDQLMPLFDAAGGNIIDTVYKVTCSKAGTLDATFSFFPLKNSEEYAVPDLTPTEVESEEVEEVEVEVEEPAPVKKVAPAPAAKPATKKKNFWEE